jgi:hypothetical protein
MSAETLPKSLLEDLLEAWVDLLLAYAPLVDFKAVRARHLPAMLRGVSPELVRPHPEDPAFGFEQDSEGRPIAQMQERAQRALNFLLYLGLLLLSPDGPNQRPKVLEALRTFAAGMPKSSIVLMPYQVQFNLLGTAILAKPTPTSVAADLRYRAALAAVQGKAKEQDR